MNILVVSESIYNKGVVYDLHKISEGLAVRGHKVFILDPGDKIGETNSFDQINRLGNVKGNVRLISPSLPSLTYNFFGFKNISKATNWFLNRKIRMEYLIYAFNQSKCDVVLLYSGIRLGPECVRLSKKRNIPVVFRNVDKLYNLTPNNLQQIISIYREHKTYQKIYSSLALTPSYRDYLIELGANPKTSIITPFPIDTRKFSPKNKSDYKTAGKIGVPKEFLSSKIIVFVGTFYEFGGLARLIISARDAVEQGLKFRLLLVGDGPIKEDLDRLVSQFNLNKYVHITGYLPFELMPQCINLAEVCINVFPVNARTNDIFSAKIIQYLACGKPVVSSNLSGIRRALSTEETGVIYQDDIDKVLLTAISLLNQEDVCKMIGKKGRGYVLNNHKVDLVLEIVEESLRSAHKSRLAPI